MRLPRIAKEGIQALGINKLRTLFIWPARSSAWRRYGQQRGRGSGWGCSYGGRGLWQ